MNKEKKNRNREINSVVRVQTVMRNAKSKGNFGTSFKQWDGFDKVPTVRGGIGYKNIRKSN